MDGSNLGVIRVCAVCCGSLRGVMGRVCRGERGYPDPRLSPRWMTGDSSDAELGCPPQLGSFFGFAIY